MYRLINKINYISFISILGLAGNTYAFDFNKHFDSIEVYAGFGVATNNLSYKKESNYNFTSSGKSCLVISGSCIFNNDLSLDTSSSIDFNSSSKSRSNQLVPSFGINFTKGRYSTALEASYFIGDINFSNSAANWKTLPTNPNGIGGNILPNSQPFIVSPMGDSINASLDEKFSNIFTLSVLPGYQFTDWLKGFAKVGWSTMKFSSSSKNGTNGGAGYFGYSGNYSKRIHGLVLGLGLETRYNGFDFRLEYNRVQYSGFTVESKELGSTAQNTVTTPTQSGFNAIGDINFQGNTKTSYKKITNDIIMLSVIKKFDLLGDRD